jgi:hypothetical protein
VEIVLAFSRTKEPTSATATLMSTIAFIENALYTHTGFFSIRTNLHYGNVILHRNLRGAGDLSLDLFAVSLF